MKSNLNFMISAQKLNELVKKNEKIVIIDVRNNEEYSNGHIINAVNFPEIFTYLPEGMTTKEEKEDFVSFYKDIFSKAGVDSNDTVVLYENKFTLMSPRGLLILKYLGHDETKIKVLDGGYYSWCKKNFETSCEFVQNQPKDFTPMINENFFVDYNEMRDIVKDDSIVKLDVRDKDEWVGISSSPYGINFAPKKGRIPNCVWIEWYDFITKDMLSVASLDKIQTELSKKAIKEDDKIVMYCFKGARIANSYIALRKLGYKNIRVYFAGWNEWCRKDDAPIINEVQNNDNPILQENILLKNKLDMLNLKQANLIDFAKYNKQPIFAFTREGELCSANAAAKQHLSHIVKLQDIMKDFTQKDIYNLIDNNQEKNITIAVEDRYYATQVRGSRDSNKILVYCFDTTELTILKHNLQEQVEKEIKERKKQEQLAVTDKLTGLYNRAYIDMTLEFEISRMNRSEALFSIILIDIDYFKNINDEHGHLIGDKILIFVSNILKKHSRSSDIIGRWGGEEFLIICPTTDSFGIKALAFKLCYEISHYDFIDVKKVTASFGITTYIKNDTINSMLQRADKALYEAKDKGRNRIEIE